jgi:protein-S-isoprenylcysteine O-methyltransferase Ste14
MFRGIHFRSTIHTPLSLNKEFSAVEGGPLFDIHAESALRDSREPAMPLAASLRTRIIQMTDFAEAYLLSAMYLYQAAYAAWNVVQNLALRPTDSLDPVGNSVARGLWLVGTIRDLDLFLVFLLIGLFLLFRHPAAEGPRELKEVFVPLAVTLFFLAYRLPPLLPQFLSRPLAPLPVMVSCAIASLFFGAAGSLIAVWGIISLGRSFGIFVAVRKVVLVGPYRYVRHPIYSGYVLIWVGIVLANLSIAIVALVAIHTMLMIYRARLEERRLAEASPEYRAYLQETGFLFPRLGAG